MFNRREDKSPIALNMPVPALDSSSPPKSYSFSSDNDYMTIPTIPRSGNPPRITGKTLIEILRGAYDSLFNNLYIIDCRYKYEYEGGHIKGAININDPRVLHSAFFESIHPNSIVVFHCEYSQQRGPKMASIFRHFDREANKEKYPNLFYEKVYILNGGYREFYNLHKEYTTGKYVRMNDEGHMINGDLVKSTSQYRYNIVQYHKKNQSNLITLSKHSQSYANLSPTMSQAKDMSPIESKKKSLFQ